MGTTKTASVKMFLVSFFEDFSLIWGASILKMLVFAIAKPTVAESHPFTQIETFMISDSLLASFVIISFF